MDGAELRGRRAALGLSQSALGAVLGVARNTIARWERGELTIENPQMLDLALQRLEETTMGTLETVTGEPQRITFADGRTTWLRTIDADSRHDHDRCLTQTPRCVACGTRTEPLSHYHGGRKHRGGWECQNDIECFGRQHSLTTEQAYAAIAQRTEILTAAQYDLPPYDGSLFRR